MMHPPLSFFFFSSSRLSPTATARLRNEWWVGSLFLLLWLPRRDFLLSFSSALITTKRFFTLFFFCSDYPLGISAGFSAKRDLLKKILENQNLQLRHLNPQSSSLFTIENFFRRYRGLNPGLLSYHVFDAFTVNQHWCRHEIGSTRRYLVAFSLEVPCRGS